MTFYYSLDFSYPFQKRRRAIRGVAFLLFFGLVLGTGITLRSYYQRFLKTSPGEYIRQIHNYGRHIEEMYELWDRLQKESEIILPYHNTHGPCSIETALRTVLSLEPLFQKPGSLRLKSPVWIPRQMWIGFRGVGQNRGVPGGVNSKTDDKRWRITLEGEVPLPETEKKKYVQEVYHYLTNALATSAFPVQMEPVVEVSQWDFKAEDQNVTVWIHLLAANSGIEKPITPSEWTKAIEIVERWRKKVREISLPGKEGRTVGSELSRLMPLPVAEGVTNPSNKSFRDILKKAVDPVEVITVFRTAGPLPPNMEAEFQRFLDEWEMTSGRWSLLFSRHHWDIRSLQSDAERLKQTVEAIKAISPAVLRGQLEGVAQFKQKVSKSYRRYQIISEDTYLSTELYPSFPPQDNWKVDRPDLPSTGIAGTPVGYGTWNARWPAATRGTPRRAVLPWRTLLDAIERVEKVSGASWVETLEIRFPGTTEQGWAGASEVQVKGWVLFWMED